MKTSTLVTALTILSLYQATADEIDLTATDQYGGLLAIKTEATGWFRTEKMQGRWVFVTPDGHGYLALGANHVGKYLDRQAKEMGLLDRFGGSREEAAEFLIEAMAELGLNSGEAYHPIAPEIKDRLPWVANLRFPFPSKFAFDVFDPDVVDRIHRSFEEQGEEFRENRFVLGVACADLPIWDERRIGFYEALPPGAPGRIALESARKAGHSDDEFLGQVADTLYQELRSAVAAAAPNHLFFGERFYLRSAPDEVIAAVGRQVDVFCTQALILSPQRPPEWQDFQRGGYDHEAALIGDKPMLMVDWAAPFSLGKTFQTERGEIRSEERAAEDAAAWMVAAMETPYLVGIFKCQLLGTHANDAWFDGRARRTYLRDDGTPFGHRTEITRRAHEEALRVGYEAAIQK
ncbi:MAG: hypothetical protein AAF236_15060 [Verrucomicrobiota bacterium]